VLFLDPAESGKVYWEFTMQRGDNISTGVTVREKFAKGYANRCMCFCRNLSNGNELLVSNFGPNVKQGDVVGVLCDFQPSTLVVSFYHNSTFLGEAFRVPAPYPKPLLPCVCFGTQGGSVSVVRKNPPGSGGGVSIAHPIAQPQPIACPVGHWTLQTINNIPVNGEATLLVEGGSSPDSYKLAGKVINAFTTTITRSGPSWTSTPMPSTMMAGPPHLMELEGKVKDVLQSVAYMAIETGELVIRSGNSTEIKFAPAKVATAFGSSNVCTRNVLA